VSRPRRIPVALLGVLAGVLGLLVLCMGSVGVVVAVWPWKDANAPPVAKAALVPQPQPDQPPQPQLGQPPPDQPGQPPPKDPAIVVAAGGLPPDPLPAPMVIAANPPIAIRLPTPVDLLYPTTPSPFVAVAGNSGGNTVRTFWDLRSGKQTGALTVDGERYQQFALSPDGTHVAATVKEGAGQTVEVWSVADGKSVRRIDTTEPGFGMLFPCDFAGPGQLVTNQSGPGGSLVRVWDVNTGQCLRRFQAPVDLLGIRISALSPGRRYLASIQPKHKRLVICDLAAGKVAADWLIPDPTPASFKVPWAIAFSHDGRSLHLMSFGGLSLYLATWDLSTGKGSARKINGLGNINNPLLSGMFDTGPLLEGLPDGTVIVAGFAVVDPATGAVVRKIPEPSFRGDARRIFGTTWARITGPEGNWDLAVLPFPPP
jgi:hypothetical protein